MSHEICFNHQRWRSRWPKIWVKEELITSDVGDPCSCAAPLRWVSAWLAYSRAWFAPLAGERGKCCASWLSLGTTTVYQLPRCTNYHGVPSHYLRTLLYRGYAWHNRVMVIAGWADARNCQDGWSESEVVGGSFFTLPQLWQIGTAMQGADWVFR